MLRWLRKLPTPLAALIERFIHIRASGAYRIAVFDFFPNILNSVQEAA